MAREDAVDYFNPRFQERCRAHSAMNMLLCFTDSYPLFRHCWVCGWQTLLANFRWEVLDDDAVWQPLCSVACWARLPAPDVRWNVTRFGEDHHSLGTADMAQELHWRRYEAAANDPDHDGVSSFNEWPDGDEPAPVD